MNIFEATQAKLKPRRMVWAVVRHPARERFHKQRRQVIRHDADNHPSLILLHVFVYGLRRAQRFGASAGPGPLARKFPWNTRRKPR